MGAIEKGVMGVGEDSFLGGWEGGGAWGRGNNSEAEKLIVNSLLGLTVTD